MSLSDLLKTAVSETTPFLLGNSTEKSYKVISENELSDGNQPTDYLLSDIAQAEKELESGDYETYNSADEFIASLPE